MEHIIEVKGLKKNYGDVEAVKGIDFYVQKGALFAFLGPNGAGKSTSIDIICTLLKADSGIVNVNGYTLGKDDDQIRSKIGVVFQDNLLDSLLTVKENLEIRGSFYGLLGKELKGAVEHAASVAGAKDFIGRRYGKLSGGQRRRADIARALINTPEILFLDEPTTGLDPQTRKSVWDTIRNLQKEKGVTVFLTTHYMEEAANADYVAVIDNGLITAKGTPRELRQQYSFDSLKLVCDETKQAEEIVKSLQAEYSIQNNIIDVKLKNTFEALPVIEKVKPYISAFEVLQGSMDDAFINITGKEMR